MGRRDVLRRFKVAICNPLISLCVGSCVGVLRRLRRLLVNHWKRYALVLRRSASVVPPYPPIGRTAPFGVGRPPLGGQKEQAGKVLHDGVLARPCRRRSHTIIVLVERQLILNQQAYWWKVLANVAEFIHYAACGRHGFRERVRTMSA